MQTQSTSFPETADIESSSDEYAGRFAGAVGEWMLHVQEVITLDMLKHDPGASILDVGGGHGQLVRPLCRDGYPVTVLSSSAICSKRIQDLIDEKACLFQVGNVIELPFEDKSFDYAISFRMVTHTRAWDKLIAELCRVARKGVIVDYPTSQSINAVAPALFGAKKRVEKNTRHWKLFQHDEVSQAFEANGFTIATRRGQFFLPMVLHRMLKIRTISSLLETLCRGLGLTKYWGSPVIVFTRPRS